MKERPILFSAPMVRAILDGSKTQTRRAIKSRWKNCHVELEDGIPMVVNTASPEARTEIYCPYGQPGDRLWVRETWQGPLLDFEEHEAQFRDDGPEAFKKPGFFAYRATDTLDAVDADGNDLGWRPSIHMPRWASRILLEVTGVRVERLQDISEADAIAEGCQAIQGCEWRTFEEADAGVPMHKHTAIDAYSALWDAINGEGSWDANPWVWVVEFKQVEA